METKRVLIPQLVGIAIALAMALIQGTTPMVMLKLVGILILMLIVMMYAFAPEFRNAVLMTVYRFKPVSDYQPGEGQVPGPWHVCKPTDDDRPDNKVAHVGYDAEGISVVTKGRFCERFLNDGEGTSERYHPSCTKNARGTHKVYTCYHNGDDTWATISS